jgi:DNA-directed RNA polymerase specialized sigma24 family protein
VISCKTSGPPFRCGQKLLRFDRPEDLVAFLVRMAKNKVTTEARRRLVRARHNLNREQPWESIKEGTEIADRRAPTALERLAEAEQWEKFRSTLPEPHRQILELRIQGFAHAEIRERLGIAKRTFWRIWRNLLRLCERWFGKESE